MLVRVAAGQTIEYLETVGLHKNGSSVELSVTISPIYDRQGKGGGASQIARDITARKQTEESLRERPSGIQGDYENTPCGLAVLDRDLRYVRVNMALAEMTGVPAADHIGRLAWEVERGTREADEPLMRRVLETGELVQVEASGEIPKLPGVIRHWDKNYYPL